MTKILVLGANGMLGGSLLRYFSGLSNYNVVGTVRSDEASDALANIGYRNTISNVNVLDYSKVEEVVSKVDPDVVFNCIGLIKQLSSAKLHVPAIEINSLLPHKLASICKNYGAKLVHFSTDCVFSGKVGAYKEGDLPDATDIYGRSKLLGEVDYDGHLTLRTSIIGHELNSSVSLVDWFLSQKKSVNGYSRAIFSGLPTCFVAEFLHKYVLDRVDFCGLYHLSVDPIDKYSLLNLIKEIYGLDTEIVESSEFIIDRSLNSDKLRGELNFIPPSWVSLIERMHSEYTKSFAR